MEIDQTAKRYFTTKVRRGLLLHSGAQKQYGLVVLSQKHMRFKGWSFLCVGCNLIMFTLRLYSVHIVML